MATGRLSQIVQLIGSDGTSTIRVSQLVVITGRRRRIGTLPVLLKTDTADQDDDGEPFQAYVKSPAVPPSGDVTTLGQVQLEPQVIADASEGVSLQLTITRDFGLGSQPSTVDLSPEGSETRVIKKFEGAATADAKVLEFTIGDAEAIASQWAIDRLNVPIDNEGDS